MASAAGQHAGGQDSAATTKYQARGDFPLDTSPLVSLFHAHRISFDGKMFVTCGNALRGVRRDGATGSDTHVTLTIRGFEGLR